MPDSFLRTAFRGDNRFLLRIAIIAAVGGFLFGYDTGIVSGAQVYISRDFLTTRLEQQWIVGSLLIGAIVGAAIAGWSSDRISRKWTKVCAGCLYLAGAWPPRRPRHHVPAGQPVLPGHRGRHGVVHVGRVHLRAGAAPAARRRDHL